MSATPSPRSSALVTGACGILGSVFVRRLVDERWAVRGICRRQPSAADGVEIIAADVLDTDAVRRAAQGVDVVFHLAACVDTFSKPANDVMRRVNIEGTASVARAARAEGVGRLVYLSTTAVYGPTRGSVADEHFTPAPDSEYARTKLEAERFVLEGGGVVLRAAAVYGPNAPGRYLALARFLRYGLVKLVGQNRRTLVFEADLADAALVAARHPAAGGRIFNVTDGAVHSLTAITNAIRAALGLEGPVLRVPVDWTASLVGMVSRRGDRLSRSNIVSAARKLAEDSAVDGGSIQRELGFRPSWPLDAGWRATIGAWRVAGRV